MEKRIIYTDSAKERLNQLQSRIGKDVEEYFQERKYVPGDDFIEITASDIDRVSNRIRIVQPTNSTSTVKQTIFFIYFLGGIISIIGGLYFDELQAIIKGDPKRLALILGGIVMITFSFVYQSLARNKIQRDDKERKLQEMEQKLKEMQQAAS